MDRKKAFQLSGLLAISLAILLLSGCTSSQPPAGPGTGSQTSIILMQKDRVGQYFADSRGMALYIFTKDTGTESVCVGGCLTAWPVFYTENLVVPQGLDRNDFGEITHPTGAKMTTYKGWPLYYYFQDNASGDINGEGVGNVWYVAKKDYKALFSTINASNHLVDEEGMTLYYFTRDSKDTSVCEGQCLVNWPIFYDADGSVPTTVTNKEDFGTIIHPTGQNQTTYKGWPLYYYASDVKRGDRLGEGVGGVWFTIDPQALGNARSATPSVLMSFFVTGQNPGNGGNLGGLEGADDYCQTLAASVGAGGGEWRAYLSTTGPGGEDARDRIGDGPWFNYEGVNIADDVASLHLANNLNKETALNEKGQVINGRGDTPNRHDILTGSDMQGRAVVSGNDTTCSNWRSSANGSAIVGHSDRIGLDDSEAARSWVSSHASRGCNLEALQSTGGDGLVYCFAKIERP